MVDVPPPQPDASDAPSRHFERYRRTGAPDALAAVFDAVAPELARIAAHVAPDAASADDLVQQCFLRAIERARHWDARRPVTPWLTGILVRDAARARRRAARRPDPARLDARTAADASRGAIDAETRRAIESALPTLPKRYREVVAATLLEGKSAAELGARFSRPSGTVRVQLHRGLELLRRALPSGLALGALPPVPRGLDRIRAAVVDAAAAKGPPLPHGLLATGLIMSSKAILSVLAVVSVLGALLWVRGEGAAARGEPQTTNAGIDRSAAPNEPPRRANAPVIAAARTAADVAARSAIDATVDQTEMAPDEASAADLPCSIVGRLLNADGEPVEQPSITFVSEAEPDIPERIYAAEERTSSSEQGPEHVDGGFRVEVPSGARGTLVAGGASGPLRSLSLALDPEAPVHDVGDLRLENSVSISGSATSNGAAPPTGSIVLAQPEFTSTGGALLLRSLVRSGDHFVRGGAVAAVWPDGTFELAELTRGVVYRLVLVANNEGPFAPRHTLMPPTLGVSVSAPARGVRIDDAWIDVDLLLRGAGAPVADGRIRQELGPDDPRADLPRELLGDFARPRPADESGRVPLRIHAATPLRIVAEANGFEPVETVVDPRRIPDGGTVEVDLVARRDVASLAIELEGAGREQLEGASAMLLVHDRQRAANRLGPVRVSGGVARFDDVPTGLSMARFIVVQEDVSELVTLPLVAVRPAPIDVRDLEAGEERSASVPVVSEGRVEVTLAGSADPKRLRLELLEANGNPVRPPLYAATARGHRSLLAPDGPGPFALGMTLPPGTYAVRALVGTKVAAEEQVTVTGGAVTSLTLHVER